jgi:FkbM family methyltransferase
MSETNAPAELELLLSEDVESARDRERSTFDRLAGPCANKIVLFGAGLLGRRTARGLRSLGIEPLAFADNNHSGWGTQIEGVPVMSPQDAAKQFGDDAVFVVTIWTGSGTERMSTRCEFLATIGCSRVLPFTFLYWKHPEVFLPHWAVDSPHKVLLVADRVRRAFELLDDEASRREYVAQIRWRLHSDFDALPAPVAHDMYFADDLLVPDEREVFIDCGAYDGDTVKSFLRHRGDNFSSLTCFEPDPVNFARLRDYLETLPASTRNKIRLHPFAVGDRHEKVRFQVTGTGSSMVGAGAEEVECVVLDEFLDGESPTWLKMDIEGAEFAAIRGARRLIGEHAPVLTVCVYHQQDHLWEIPLLIQSLSSKYRCSLRPHFLESWDVVFYAVPPGRART